MGKLKKVLNLNQSSGVDDKKIFKMKALVIKNAILTMLGSLSTIINWILWILLSNSLSIGPMLIYLDLFTNSLLIGLMFNYNDKYYKILCKYCIVYCLVKLDKGYDHTKQDEIENREKKVNRYLNKIDLSSRTSTTM